MSLKSLAALASLSAPSLLCGAVTLSPLFSDHAVLQREKPVAVWGLASPGEPVEVSFIGQTVRGVADEKGFWKVTLAPLAATEAGAELVVKGKESVVKASDVLVGEVWLASGQSNMEWPLAAANDAAQEMAAAKNPLIRHLKVERAKADAPQTTLQTHGWSVCSPETAGNFTAVGYFFAKEIQTRLRVPVAIINVSWGGTPIEAWMSTESFHGNPILEGVLPRWIAEQPELKKKAELFEKNLALWTAAEAVAKAAGKPFKEVKPEAPGELLYPNQPACLFNGMLSPVVPFGIRGFLWYQGESNTGRPKEYQTLLGTMITDWRARFGQGNLPFYFVQLANFKGWNKTTTEWAVLREGQTKVLALPETGQAITIDIGVADDVHPKNKKEVGRRLALLARARVYGQSVDDSGPVFSGFERHGHALHVRFSHTSSALTAHEKPLMGFEIAGADKKYYKAKGKIAGDTVILSAPEVKEPLSVRYDWHNAPDGNLYNGAGLPAVPFRTDDWD